MATEDNAAQTPAVDETPISVTGPNPARKNSLVNHLLHRPDRHELIESMLSTPLAAQRLSCRAPVNLPVRSTTLG